MNINQSLLRLTTEILFGMAGATRWAYQLCHCVTLARHVPREFVRCSICRPHRVEVQ